MDTKRKRRSTIKILIVVGNTANRTAKISAGQFAVVNTNEDLDYVLAGGVETKVNDSDDSVIDVNTGKRLTDGTVDHTSYSANPTIIAPDASGVNVARIESYNIDSANKANLQRGDVNTYTAFTWDITFKLSFSEGQTKKFGLFLDLTAADSWMHEKFVAPDDDGEGAGTIHTFTEDDEGTYYTDAACTQGEHTYSADDTVAANTLLFKKAPDDTGKGFRLAFIPKSVPANSLGLSKVWADNQEKAKCSFIDLDKPDDVDPDAAYSVDDLVYVDYAVYKCKTAVEAGTSRSWNDIKANFEPVTLASKVGALASATKTTSLVNGVWSEATVGEGKVIMDKDDTTGLPADGELSSSSALTGNSNYLGYFAPAAGTVSLTYTVVAYYEGTDENIVNNEDTIYETMTVGMKFGVAKLSD